MGGYFTFFVFLLCILPAYGGGEGGYSSTTVTNGYQTTKQTTQQPTTAKPSICWNARWFNSFTPTQTNRSDYEHQSAKILDSLCASGSPIGAHCKDQKGEPFSGYKNDTVGKFIATCNVVRGLICNPYNNTINATCPDFQIQYGCNCPKSTTATIAGGKTTIVTGKVTTGTTAAVSTSNPGSGSGTGQSVSGQQHGQCGNSGQKLGISQIVLLLCLIIITFC